MDYNGSFKSAFTELRHKASRAMYSLTGKCSQLDFSIASLPNYLIVQWYQLCYMGVKFGVLKTILKLKGYI